MSKPSESHTIFLEFNDNEKLSDLVGPHDQHLLRIEERLNVSVALRGNKIAIDGLEPEIDHAKTTLQYLYARLEKKQEVNKHEVDMALKLATSSISVESKEDKKSEEISIPTKKRIVFPRTPNQAKYIQVLQDNDLVFGVGPAGTGKTYLAVAIGVSKLIEGEVDRIILSRPAVEAGEKLGFLPGDMREKVDPYLRPLYDAIHDMMPGDQVLRRLESGEIEVAPLAFMRGRTLSNAFVVLDEGQNTTPIQMKMFLTRLGNNSQMVVTGDLTQIDLPPGTQSGLRDSLNTLEGIKGIGVVEFNEGDVVRNPLVSKIVEAYNKKDRTTSPTS